MSLLAIITAFAYYCLTLAGTEILHAHIMNACPLSCI